MNNWAIFLIVAHFQDKVRVEIKSFDVLEDGEVVPRDDSPGDKAQNLQQIKEKAMTRKNAVNNFLDGKNCLTGVRYQKFHTKTSSQNVLLEIAFITKACVCIIFLKFLEFAFNFSHSQLAQ
jgi:hypothetical protein